MFRLANDNGTTLHVHRRNGKICIPMTGHTFAGVCVAIKFFYQWNTSNWENTPSKSVWRDNDTARLILQFAHNCKINMKNVLKDCDICLPQKAQEDQGRRLFSNQDAVVMWAALAEECTLGHLLSHAELFMAKTLTPTSWLRDNPVTFQLSQACLCRVLRATQQYIIDFMQNQEKQARELREGNLLNTKCQGRPPPLLHHGWCSYCKPPPKMVPAEYILAEDLRRWQ